jgi:putative ABC transport system permease protein
MLIRRETWQVAFDALRANKVKAALTMLGVVIGSACIVLVVTVALTGKKYIIAQIEGVGSNIVYAQVMRVGAGQAAPLADEITLADLEAVRKAAPLAAAVAGTRETPMTVVVEGIERPVNLVGVTEEFQSIRRLQIQRGRFLDADDMVSRSKVCLLTEQLAEKMFPYEDPVGQTVRVGELRFTVVGVFRERVSTFGQSEIKRESVVIPFPLLKYYTGQEFVRVLYAQAAQPEDVPALTRQVAEVLSSRHRAGVVYQVENLSSILEAAGKISFALTIILLLVAFIALMISGIGIMNIQLVTVTQRTREIGIRKAIGAPKREILYQFLIEAFVISGIGAVAGIFIAVSIPALLRWGISLAQVILDVKLGVDPATLTFPISWISVVVAFFVSCMTGVIFGYLPANRAAKLQPTESLRYE